MTAPPPHTELAEGLMTGDASDWDASDWDTSNWDPADWQSACRERLEWALEEVLVRLGGDDSAPVSGLPDRGTDKGDEQRAPGARPNALDRTTLLFGLSVFERDLLVLAAGLELDGRVAQALGGPLTLTSASSRLPGAHWSALAPDGPLRRGRLLELARPVPPGPAGGLPSRPIRIDEALFHELLGLPQLDGLLRPVVDPLALGLADGLLDSQLETAERLAAVWGSRGSEAVGEGLPVITLVSSSDAPDPSTVRAVTVAAARSLGWSAFALDLGRLAGAAPGEVEELAERWRRDALLQSLVLVVETGDGGSASVLTAARHWLSRVDGPVVVTGTVATEAMAGLEGGGLGRPGLRLDLSAPRSGETVDSWRRALSSALEIFGAGSSGVGGEGQALRFGPITDGLARQFSLPASAIAEVAVESVAACVGRRGEGDPADPGAAGELERELWRRARRRARGGLDTLAQRLEPLAQWDDLILPAAQAEVLRSVAAHVRQRGRVYETWGFAGKGRRGLGIGALFSGPSGTGKTLAAEVLACELELDLYRIDLSALVSKYIGETERNLRRLFDAAERSGAILLFDEADSLFGKRSEVKDSHDRYANLEVSYLLQRVEAYRGLAILTTNFEKSVDTAFLRRLRFVVPFPFPGAAERRRIWGRVFPEATPTEGLDLGRLSQLSVTGGSIRNIALGAAFRAADEDRAVTMLHIQAAARAELAKLDRPVPEAELRGWVS